MGGMEAQKLWGNFYWAASQRPLLMGLTEHLDLSAPRFPARLLEQEDRG